MEVSGDLRAIGRAVASVEDAALSRLDRMSAGDQLALIQSTVRRRRSSRRRNRWAGCLALGVGGIAAAAMLWPRPGAPEFRVGEPAVPGGVGATYEAPHTMSIPIRFPDGAWSFLGAGAQGRVVAVSEHGAHMALERGTICFGVPLRSDNDWRVMSGPFVIRTAGADFDASWDVDGERLDVIVHRNSVQIRGDCLEAEIVLKEGQFKTVSCRPARWESRAPPDARSRAAAAHSDPWRPCN